MQHVVKPSPMDVVKRVFLGKKLLSVCGGYMPGESLWVHSNGVNGKPTFHRRANLSWLSKICNHLGEIPAGSPKSLTLIKQKCFFGEKTPYGQIFTNVSQAATEDTETRLLCKFREIWSTGSRWNLALFNGQKKTKIQLALPLPLLSRSRPKIPQISSKSVHFRRRYSRTREHR